MNNPTKDPPTRKNNCFQPRQGGTLLAAEVAQTPIHRKRLRHKQRRIALICRRKRSRRVGEAPQAEVAQVPLHRTRQCHKQRRITPTYGRKPPSQVGEVRREEEVRTPLRRSPRNVSKLFPEVPKKNQRKVLSKAHKGSDRFQEVQGGYRRLQKKQT